MAWLGCLLGFDGVGGVVAVDVGVEEGLEIVFGFGMFNLVVGICSFQQFCIYLVDNGKSMRSIRRHKTCPCRFVLVI